MKKAFSLAEVMITLAIMGVITSMLIPTLMTSIPNSKKYLYKAAYKNVEDVVVELINDASLYPMGNLENSTDAGFFCNNFTSKINTIGAPDCLNKRVPSSAAATPNFIATNGMRWYGLVNSFTAASPNYENVWVDVDGINKGNNFVGEDILRIHIQKTGKIVISDCPENKFLTDNAVTSCP
jgi:prepilin-type N-terminal cleavage/methylation domain-containing protein